MKRLIIHLAHPTEPDCVDRIEVREGVTLRDTSDVRNRPFLPSPRELERHHPTPVSPWLSHAPG